MSPMYERQGQVDGGGGLGKQFWYVIMCEDGVPSECLAWRGEMGFNTSECGNFELFMLPEQKQRIRLIFGKKLSFCPNTSF